MRAKLNILKYILVVAAIVGLYVFSSFKSSARKPAKMEVIFTGDENLYISEEAVNKLLIQNNQHVTSMPKETLDLNELEGALRRNAMIKSAEVYLTVNNEVRVEVVQRKPIARVHAQEHYYIDDVGEIMPLSENRSARVPLVTGSINKKDVEDVFQLAKSIQEDSFLKKNVVEIHVNADGSLSMMMRAQTFEVYLGNLDYFNKKVSNLKAFYQKIKKDNAFEKYSKVNLQFEDQVVCTKK